MTTATRTAPTAFRPDSDESERQSRSWDMPAVQDSVVVEPAPPQVTSVWMDFISRLLKYVEWEPGWDGGNAEHIDHSTARTALETAESMQAVAPVPFVAPAPSGSLLLQWDFPDGTSVEVYVDNEADFPEWAALTRAGVVYEIELTGPAGLRALLQQRVPVTTAG